MGGGGGQVRGGGCSGGGGGGVGSQVGCQQRIEVFVNFFWGRGGGGDWVGGFGGQM